MTSFSRVALFSAFILASLVYGKDFESMSSGNASEPVVIGLPDGSVYEGPVDREGRLSGVGILKWATGAEYRGEFRRGLIDGKGIYKHADGSVSSGVFRRGIIGHLEKL